jgi:hypothetical protein
MVERNERVELEMKIMKYRSLARDAPDEVTARRMAHKDVACRIGTEASRNR